MNELNAYIDAATLKRVIGVLAAIDDKAIFDITPEGITCTIVDLHNTQQTTVTIPEEACDHYSAESFKAGVDLRWMKDVLDCTPDAADVNMSIDETEIHLDIGMHGMSQKLIDPGEMSKPSQHIELSPAAMMKLSGGFFVAMVKYVAAIGADALEICANKVDVAFRSWYDPSDSRRYDVGVDCLIEYLGDARGLYSTDYLVGIADHIQPTDEISLRLGTDKPIEIVQVVNGCEIKHLLAPRIEV